MSPFWKHCLKTESMSYRSTNPKGLNSHWLSLMLRGFSLTTSSHVDLNIIKRSFSYSSSGKVFVPEQFFHGGAEVSYNAEGDRIILM